MLVGSVSGFVQVKSDRVDSEAQGDQSNLEPTDTSDENEYTH